MQAGANGEEGLVAVRPMQVDLNGRVRLVAEVSTPESYV